MATGGPLQAIAFKQSWNYTSSVLDVLLSIPVDMDLLRAYVRTTGLVFWSTVARGSLRDCFRLVRPGLKSISFCSPISTPIMSWIFFNS